MKENTKKPPQKPAKKLHFNDWFLRVSEFLDCYDSPATLTFEEFLWILRDQTPKS